MDCACIDIDLDEDGGRILSDVMLKARKRYQCEECQQWIEVGEKYSRESWADGRKVYMHRMCEGCRSVRDNLFCSWYYGMIWRLLEDEIIASDGDISQTAIGHLTPWARDKVCDMIEQYWDEWATE